MPGARDFPICPALYRHNHGSSPRSRGHLHPKTLDRFGATNGLGAFRNGVHGQPSWDRSIRGRVPKSVGQRDVDANQLPHPRGVRTRAPSSSVQMGGTTHCRAPTSPHSSDRRSTRSAVRRFQARNDCDLAPMDRGFGDVARRRFQDLRSPCMRADSDSPTIRRPDHARRTEPAAQAWAIIARPATLSNRPLRRECHLLSRTAGHIPMSMPRSGAASCGAPCGRSTMVVGRRRRRADEREDDE